MFIRRHFKNFWPIFIFFWTLWPKFLINFSTNDNLRVNNNKKMHYVMPIEFFTINVVKNAKKCCEKYAVKKATYM